jgi:hypothetical protein
MIISSILLASASTMDAAKHRPALLCVSTTPVLEWNRPPHHRRRTCSFTSLILSAMRHCNYPRLTKLAHQPFDWLSSSMISIARLGASVPGQRSTHQRVLRISVYGNIDTMCIKRGSPTILSVNSTEPPRLPTSAPRSISIRCSAISWDRPTTRPPSPCLPPPCVPPPRTGNGAHGHHAHRPGQNSRDSPCENLQDPGSIYGED